MDVPLSQDGRLTPQTVGVPIMGRKSRLQLGDAYHVMRVGPRALVAAPGLPFPVPIDAKSQVRVMERADERFLKIGSFQVNPSWIGWAAFHANCLILGGVAGKYHGTAVSPDESEIIVRSCGLVSVNAFEMVNPELAVWYDPGLGDGFACGHTFRVQESRVAHWVEAITSAGWIPLPGGRMANPRQAMMIRDTLVTYTPEFSHFMRETNEAGWNAIGEGAWCAVDIRLSINLDGLRKLSRAVSPHQWKRTGIITLVNGCQADVRADKLSRVIPAARRIYPHLEIERYQI